MEQCYYENVLYKIYIQKKQDLLKNKKFLLIGNKCMPEIHLKEPGFTYSACEPCTKNKEKITKLKEIGDTKNIYRNELDKVCFQHDMI